MRLNADIYINICVCIYIYMFVSMDGWLDR